MKKICLNSCLHLLTFVLLFASCSDNDNETNEWGDPAATPEVDYTVIFWAMNGKLDECVFADLGDIVNMRQSGEIGKNVHFTGLVKTSPKSIYSDSTFQQSLAAYGYEGTQMIDLPENPVASLPSMRYTGEDVSVKTTEMMAQIYKAYNAKKFAETDYQLDNPDNLANFIRRVAALHPAKHYVLMFLGHGSGFLPYLETANNAGYTRACVHDSWTEGAITADKVVAAVNGSGVHIQTLFFQNCLQSTLENLAAYQHCADYAIVSAEISTSQYLQQYLAYLSQAGDDLTKMAEAARKTVDFYADVVNPDSEYFTSHGFWNLSKVDGILQTVAQISDWYCKAIDQDSDFINTCVMKTLQITDFYTSVDGKTDDLEARDNIYRIINDEAAMADPKSLQNLANSLAKVASVESPYGFGFAHLLATTLSLRSDPTFSASLDFSELQTLSQSYLQQLKEAAYLRANYELDNFANYDYLFVSPTINLFAMNEAHYHLPSIISMSADDRATRLEAFANAVLKDDPIQDEMFHDLFDGNIFAKKAPLATVQANYEASQFDKQCHWSKFLKKLSVNPSYLTNPSRRDYNAAYGKSAQ